MRSIQWTEQGQHILSPLQRDAYERGGDVPRLEGRITTDENGVVWYREGEHVKIVGEGDRPSHPSAEVTFERDADAPPAKKPRKRAKRR